MTIHVSTAIDVTKVKTRWEEPYVSEAIDKMMSGLGRGIHHGFRLTADGGQVIRLSQDTEYGDSLALIGDDNNDQVFVYREATEATLDLTPVTVGTRAWVFLYVDYSVGLDTTAEIRVVDSAELVNAWVNAALLLGTVRKPAAGAIDDGDIDHGSAEMLGLTGGDSSRWVPVNENPYWEKAFAGWVFTGAADSYRQLVGGGDEYKGTWAVRLGDISGAQAPADAIFAQILLPPLLANDIVFWRFKAKSSSVTNGAILQVDLGSFFSETILDADLGSYEQFGHAVEITADATDETLDIIADLTVGATTTGHFFIDEVEVFVWRPTGTVVGANMDVAGRRLSVEAGEDEAFWDASVGAMRWTDKHTTTAMTDGVDGAQFANLPVGGPLSLKAAVNQGLRAASVQNLMWPKATFEGGVVTDSGGSDVDVSALKVRATALNPTVGGTPDRYFEQSAVTNLALPVTAGVEEFFVAWDPNTEDLTAFVTGSVGANPDVVILAYVRYDGAAIDRIIDMRDLMTDLERGAPITVSNTTAGARFASLEGALRMAQATGFQGMVEFVLSGDLFIGGVGPANFPETITLPFRCLIRGDGGAQIGVSLYGGANPSDIFHVQAGGEVILQDLYFVPTVLTVGAGTTILTSPGAPKNVTLRNVIVDRATSLFNSAVAFGTAVTEKLTITDCIFDTFGTAVVHSSNSALDEIVVIRDSKIISADTVPVFVESHGGGSGGLFVTGLVVECTHADAVSKFHGRVTVNGLSTNKALSFNEAATEGARVQLTNLLIDDAVTNSAAAIRPNLIELNACKGVMSNVSIHTPQAQNAGQRGIRFTECEMAVTGVRILQDNGIAMQVNASSVQSELVLSDINITNVSVSGGNGVQFSNADGNVMANLRTKNLQDQAAFTLDGTSDDNMVADVLVDQAGAGIGYVEGGGATNYISNVNVF